MTIQVRQARPGEEAKWQASRAKAIRQGDIGSEDHSWVTFLVFHSAIPTDDGGGQQVDSRRRDASMNADGAAS
jgi:hypothetical protein